MSFSTRTQLPYRLKLLLALLAAGAAGAWLSYAGFRGALKPYSDEAAGKYLLARLDLGAAIIDGEVSSALEQARLTAARTGLRELLSRYNSSASLPSAKADLGKLLSDATASGSIGALQLAGRSGAIAATIGTGQGKTKITGADARSLQKGQPVSGPRAEDGVFNYDITVPVPPLPGDGTAPLGTLRCTFKLGPAGRKALGDLLSSGFTLALARKNGQRLVVTETPGKVREFSVKASEISPFLPALSGSEGISRMEDGAAIYGWRPIDTPGWVIAGRAQFLPFSESYSKLLAKARARALLAIALIAAAAFLVAGLLCAPLAEAGRQAAALLEQCGAPPAGSLDLREPEHLAGAIGEAAAMLKKQSSRDLALETEAEKLREEEADLKSQNDELEKLNKYLMEREIKISELKREISDLREKVGGGAQ
ncbi:MAG: hypothetical protein HY952_05885 [Elusimicrobia bacterium]|nr:hypothetical protein [Elusimicrobiota bacterium]